MRQCLENLDWNDLISADQLNYIMGNPPFLGKSNQSDEQKNDLAHVCYDIKSSKLLDLFFAGM